VHLLELVPELLEVASARPVPERVQVETHAWDAQHDDLPPVVAGCDAVLMSLFLTTLPDPLWFLDRLHRALRPGTRVVASSVRPDADLSLWFGELVDAAQAGRVTPPMGLTRHEFLEAIRAYQGSAAELLRHVEEGRFTFFSERELAALFVDAGFRVVQHDVSMGGQGSVVVATR
jgi:ubiquinone/menaquinone biosynthesis C-methylase UbiE